jgi:outer membrane biosynthesis protein TonB
MDGAIGMRLDGWRREGPGLLLSLLLHLALLLAALWYVAHRPALPPPPRHALPVEIVLAARSGSGAPTGTAATEAAARPRPQAAPRPEGVRPDGKAEPEDELSAKLRALAQLRQPDTPLPAAENGGDGAGGGRGQGGYTLRDFVRAQILRRWLPDLSAPGARDMPVLVKVRLAASGTIESVTILDRTRFTEDKLFREMALSARDAALLASPLSLPPGHYPRVSDLVINLDPKAVLR